ncbi:MAG: cupredoxin domain-containing protein [Betaproteobacteria bacterium]
MAAATVTAAAGAITGAATRAGDGVRRAGRLALVAALLAAAAPEGAPAAQPPAAVHVRASRRGFEPSRLTLRRGEPVRFVLSTADGEHCFAIDELRIEKRIVAGRETSFDLTPERTGVFAFHCCLETGEAARGERGQLTVSE